MPLASSASSACNSASSATGAARLAPSADLEHQAESPLRQARRVDPLGPGLDQHLRGHRHDLGARAIGACDQVRVRSAWPPAAERRPARAPPAAPPGARSAPWRRRVGQGEREGRHAATVHRRRRQRGQSGHGAENVAAIRALHRVVRLDVTGDRHVEVARESSACRRACRSSCCGRARESVPPPPAAPRTGRAEADGRRTPARTRRGPGA